MLGFYSATFLSFLIIAIQYLVSQISFTCLSFLFPVIAMFYIMHANPYDADMGTIDGTVLNEVVQYFHAKKKPFIFFSLFLEVLPRVHHVPRRPRAHDHAVPQAAERGL